MTNLAELLGPDLQPPEDQHCCTCQGCVTDDDVASVRRELMDKSQSRYGNQPGLRYSINKAIDALDDQIDVFEDKPGAPKAYARLEGFREDLDDWMSKLIDYLVDMPNDITSCDDGRHCEQHGGAPDPDRNRE